MLHRSYRDTAAVGELENSSCNFNEAFFSTAGGQKKNTRGWHAGALVVVLVIIFVILAILTGVLFGYYYTMMDELNVIKHNASDSNLKNEVSELWKSVSNIMGDLSKIKQKVDTTEGSCTTCPAGWKLIRSHCYYFKSTATSWDRSIDECAIRNGILLVLKDLFEMDALLPTIARERYWIGLRRDKKNNDNWVWSDGSPLSFSAWNDGEPNNDKDNEHCAEILGGVQMWNDRTCDHKLGYICKGVWSC
ncbi:perlucin-like protein isoform X2 [Pseudophryne corroboree]|uniref:perlucin-like protein isoform X2 n=1 Tax=Pseudophryne corroboree TaxID=495146 RepID=UPI0030813188